MVKSESESSEEKIGKELADETGLQEIVAVEEVEANGAAKESVDFALLKPVFVNRKDREVLSVAQETQL